MKLLTLIFLVSAQIFSVSAQWKQTAGVLGGFYTVYSGDSSLQIMVSSGNNIFVKNNFSSRKTGQLNFTPSFIIKTPSYRIIQGGNQYATSSDNGESWTEHRAPFYSNTKPAVKNDSLFQFASDTLFISANGAKTWTKSFSADSAYYTDSSGLTKRVKIFNLEKPVVTQSFIFALAASGHQGQFVTAVQSSDRGKTWHITVPANSVTSSSSLGVLGNSILISTNNGIILSTGNGTWIPAGNGLPSLPNQPVSEFVFSAGHLFAVFASASGSIYKFVNNQWQLVANGSFNYYEIETEDGILFRNIYSGDNFYLAPGETWKSAGHDIIASTSSPVALSENELMTFYKNALYYSANKGNTWSKIQDSIKSTSILSDKLYILKGTDLYFSPAVGAPWQLINSTIPITDKNQITCFIRWRNDLYMGSAGFRARTHLSPVWEQGGVYKSSNNGISWEKIITGLPKEAGVPAPVTSLFAGDGIIYANTLGGTFRFVNDVWVPFGNFLPTGESLFDLKRWKSGWVAVGSKGIYLSDSSLTSWKKYTSGLTGNFGYYYHFKTTIFRDTLYAFSSSSKDSLFYLKDSVWVISALKGPAGKQLYSLTISEKTIYAGTIEEGIWRLDQETPSQVEQQSDDAKKYFVSDIFPNPATDKIYFHLTATSAVPVLVNIFNSIGETMYSQTIQVQPAGIITLPPLGFPPGVYFLKVTIPESLRQQSFVKKFTITK